MDFQYIPPEVQDLRILRRILFASVYLPKELPDYWNILAKFATMGVDSTTTISPGTVQTLVENITMLNPDAFVTDKKLMQEVHLFQTGGKQSPLGVVLISSKSECPLCKGKLITRKDRPSHMTVYTESFGTLIGTHFHKYCQNNAKGCSFRQFYGYHTEGSQSVTFYDNDWSCLKYFVSTSETAFETSMLTRFDSELLLGQISYTQKADIYNAINGYPVPPKISSKVKKLETSMNRSCDDSSVCNRMRLDRRRFEASHLKYALLRTVERYPHLLPGSLVFTSDLTSVLRDIIPAYYDAFTRRYSLHTCTFPGCNNVLVLDGNMKNRRDVCHAKDAGYMEYPGLPGHIKTGCMESPCFKSRYCLKHSPRVCTTETDLMSQSTPTEPHQQAVIEMLLEKKVTRSTTYYKVLWLGKPDVAVTWEPESSIPPDIVKEFELGTQVHVTQHVVDSYGQCTSTLEIAKANNQQLTTAKRPRMARHIVKESAGIFSKDESTLLCNTEKDKQARLNFRTAGILAGIRPCGIVVLLSELFISESISQVYGILHNYFTKYPAANQTEFICYDDACHLRKFSRNPVRANLTKQSEQLAKIEMIVDRMHMKGHIDQWCRENCDAEKFSALDKVDTEVCEQVFSWLSKYRKITQKMNQHTFQFFLLYLCELHNIREESKLASGLFM